MPPLALWTVLDGDARELLRELAPGSVQCVVTSPPYWGLRDYGSADQIGLEPTPDAYVGNLRVVFAEVWRVLAADGTVWLNLGDSYNAYNGGAGPSSSISAGASTRERPQLESGYGLRFKGLKPKDLVGIPWRVAFALQADGWYLRSDIIWAKPNPMPESVTDRPTKSHEYLFLLAKSDRYYYNADAIREAFTYGDARPMGNRNAAARGVVKLTGNMDPSRKLSTLNDAGRNKRSVWTVPTQPSPTHGQAYTGAHFATFPEALIRPCVLAGCPVGGLVCDPFCGSGTTGAVAVGLGRNFIGCELNSSYVQLARKRIGDAAPLFAAEAVQEAVARPVHVADPELF